MMKCICDNKGSATILMVLIAGVIVTVGLGFNWLVKEHLKASDGLKNKTEAIIKARSAYDTVIYQILNGRMTQKEILFAGGQEFSELKALPLDNRKVPVGDDVYIQAQDSNGMLSLATINEAALRRLIKKEGEPGNAVDPVDSLIDWIDADDFSRANGAEAFYYRGEGLPYKPRNYPLQYKEELSMVKGMDRKRYDKIQSYLTLLPSTGFNPNTAGDAVLMSYLDINEDALKALRDYLAVKPISSDMELFPLTGRRLVREEGINYYPSYYMDIKISVGQPRSFYTIMAGLHMMQNPTMPYSVRYWIEE
jgi:general secretion pathway protein K